MRWRQLRRQGTPPPSGIHTLRLDRRRQKKRTVHPISFNSRWPTPETIAGGAGATGGAGAANRCRFAFCSSASA